MPWTPWRKIADRAYWYTHHALRTPVCFELGLGTLHDLDEPERVYVGASTSERKALLAMEGAAPGDPLGDRIRAALEEGKVIYYRALGARDLESADAERRRLEAEGTYPWTSPPADSAP